MLLAQKGKTKKGTKGEKQTRQMYTMNAEVVV